MSLNARGLADQLWKVPVPTSFDGAIRISDFCSGRNGEGAAAGAYLLHIAVDGKTDEIARASDHRSMVTSCKEYTIRNLPVPEAVAVNWTADARRDSLCDWP